MLLNLGRSAIAYQIQLYCVVSNSVVLYCIKPSSVVLHSNFYIVMLLHYILYHMLLLTQIPCIVIPLCLSLFLSIALSRSTMNTVTL